MIKSKTKNKNLKVTMMKKLTFKSFRGFQVVNLALYLKLKTRKSWKFFLLQFLIVYESQDPKSKKWLQTKKRYIFTRWINTKTWKFPRFPSFWFYLIAEIENSGKFSFTSDSSSSILFFWNKTQLQTDN